jgi:hypothetical protein
LKCNLCRYVVGRLGAFPHGIDIVAAADYFALGSRVNAYCGVADFICTFDVYKRRLLTHLCDVKLGHWAGCGTR